MKKVWFLFFMFSLLHTVVYGQQKVITGRVTDANDKTALIGTTVMVKGTQIGVATDINGNYSIKASEGDILLFSFVGMKSAEMKVAEKNVIDVELKADQELDEVVVVGYGAVRKRDLTGSVQTVKSDELMKGQPVSIEQGLQGRLAGVNVVKNDGAPGGGISVQIRGTNSFMGSTEPLYVIDGIPISSDNDAETVSFDETEVTSRNALSFLDPANIESVEVLKDASATAIYGSRGSNGVVMITTKSGQKGKDRITFGVTGSVSTVANKLRMLGGAEYAEYRNQAYINTQMINNGSFNPISLPYLGGIGALGSYVKGPADYDNDPYYWQDVVFRTAVSQNYTLNYSGATQTGDYSLGVGYLDQRGTVINSAYDRLSFNVKVNKNMRSWLKLGNTTNLSVSNSDMIKSATSNQNNGDEGVIRSALYFPATYTKEEEIGYEEYQIVSNPYDYTQALNKNKNYNIYTSSYANLMLPKGFIFRSVFSYKASLNFANRYFPKNLYEGRPVKGKALAGDTQNQTFSWDNLLMYNRTFGKHNVSATLGTSWESTSYYRKQVATHGFGSDDNDGWMLGDGTDPQAPKSSKSDAALFSIIARAAYNYKNTYFLTATFRRDASSKFAKNNKVAYFPSIGGAWRITGEDFMSNQKIVDNLKIRYSYGASGNAGIGAYGSLPLFVSANYPSGGSVNPGYATDPNNPGNPDLKWESTYQHDFGVDITLFKNLNIELDYYDKTTRDLIQRKELAFSSGFNSVLFNIGEVRNRGLEITADYKVMEKGDFEWNVGGNFSVNRNEVKDLGSKDTKIYPNQLWNDLRPFVITAGKPIGQLYGYVEEGIWNSREDVIQSGQFQKVYPGYSIYDSSDDIETSIRQHWVGEVRIKDLDGNNEINEKDQDYIGNVNPKFLYAFNMNFRYKNFDLSMLFNGVHGNDIINMSSLRFHNLGQTRNVLKSVLDNVWTPEHGGSNPKVYTTDGRSLYFSRRYVENGSYLKLRNVSFSYTLKKPIKEIESVRFFVSGNNLFTISGYSGYDPEVNAFGSNPSARGVDAGGYPQSREFSFGINVTL